MLSYLVKNPLFRIGWLIRISLLVSFLAFLHYTLPQRDIVRVVRVFEERQDINDWTRIFWSNTANLDIPFTYDMQFIQTVRPNGKVMVYRNEDTGWSWPPYFKFDTSNLFTEVADAVSTNDNPDWYLLTHYGWRNEFWTIFPNAISIKPISGPDASKGLPWLNIIILTSLGGFSLFIYMWWRGIYERRIEPIFENIQDRYDEIIIRLRKYF